MVGVALQEVGDQLPLDGVLREADGSTVWMPVSLDAFTVQSAVGADGGPWFGTAGVTAWPTARGSDLGLKWDIGWHG
jgi:hypothetical protein